MSDLCCLIYIGNTKVKIPCRSRCGNMKVVSGKGGVKGFFQQFTFFAPSRLPSYCTNLSLRWDAIFPPFRVTNHIRTVKLAGFKHLVVRMSPTVGELVI